jgi:Leu/Phe-tRNA-protein transferase
LLENRKSPYNQSMNKEWEMVYTSYGHLDASMIVDFLMAHGIEAVAMQESVGQTYGLTVGPLGESRIFVSPEHKDAAIALLEAMERGEFELPDEQEPTSTED